MTVVGLNIGSIMSLESMSLAVDYLANKEAFEPDLQDIKDKITSKEKQTQTKKKKEHARSGEIKC